MTDTSASEDQGVLPCLFTAFGARFRAGLSFSVLAVWPWQLPHLPEHLSAPAQWGLTCLIAVRMQSEKDACQALRMYLVLHRRGRSRPGVFEEQGGGAIRAVGE